MSGTVIPFPSSAPSPSQPANIGTPDEWAAKIERFTALVEEERVRTEIACNRLRVALSGLKAAEEMYERAKR